MSVTMATMVIGNCPVDADEVAEAYLLGTLLREPETAFEEHYMGCPDCVERLQFTEEFLLSFGPLGRIPGATNFSISSSVRPPRAPVKSDHFRWRG